MPNPISYEFVRPKREPPHILAEFEGRRWREQSSHPNLRTKTVMRMSLKDQVDQFLKRCSNRGQLPTVRDIAQEVTVSERHLRRTFLEDHGLSLGRYIRQELLIVARQLLTRLSTLEVSERLGYSDLSSFERFFRRECGMTPTQYRLSRRMSGNVVDGENRLSG